MAAEESVVEREHVWASPPDRARAFTLLGVAAAGFLTWLATQFDLGSTGEYWAAMGILVGAGACLGLSQLLGGWTKWGSADDQPRRLPPRVPARPSSPSGASSSRRARRRPNEGDQVAGWIRDIGLGGVAEDLIVFQGVLAFGLGIVLSFTFDTTGPRTRRRSTARSAVPDEEVHDYRTEDVVRRRGDGRAGATTAPQER